MQAAIKCCSNQVLLTQTIKLLRNSKLFHNLPAVLVNKPDINPELSAWRDPSVPNHLQQSMLSTQRLCPLVCDNSFSSQFAEKVGMRFGRMFVFMPTPAQFVLSLYLQCVDLAIWVCILPQQLHSYP